MRPSIEKKDTCENVGELALWEHNFVGNINLRNFSVLVVDQDDAHRWMLHNVLEALGVGEVLTANSNEDALNMLKRLTKREMSERIDTVDLVICELAGQPLDGSNLVRWVRMHPESPNRFLPVLLMAKAFDSKDLGMARGFGATHFLTKPATVETLSDRLLTIINRPRPFVYTGAYFGPDRRGARADRRGDDRDETRQSSDDRRDDKDREKYLVRSPLVEALERFPSDKLLRIFRPPNHLKRKAGMLDEGDGLFTEGAIFKAEKALNKAKGEYSDTALDMVESLRRILGEAGDAKDKSGHFGRIHTLATQLGMQGETFDYPLVTTVGNSLSRFTREGLPVGEASFDLVKVHIDSLTVILRNKISGDGGEVGGELVSQLQAAIKKITQAIAS